MTFRLVSELSQRIKRAATVGGVLTPSIVSVCDSLGNTPILFIHGTADPIVLWEGINPGWCSAENTVQFWMGINHCSQEAERDTFQDLDPNDGCSVDAYSYRDTINKSDVFFYKIVGGGQSVARRSSFATCLEYGSIVHGFQCLI